MDEYNNEYRAPVQDGYGGSNGNPEQPVQVQHEVIKPHIPIEDDYFRQQSYYETNPLPQRMPSSPYEPPQPPAYPNPPYVPQDLGVQKANSPVAMIFAIIITAVVVAGFAFAFVLADKYEIFDEFTLLPAEETEERESEPKEQDEKEETKDEDENNDPAETEKVDNTAKDKEVSSTGKPDNTDEATQLSSGYTSQEVYRTVVPSVVSIHGILENNRGQIAGSGIIITDDGYAVTNAHVLEGVEEMTITTYDGQEYEASIVGLDTKSDLAVFKIETSDTFTPAVLGDSDELEIGEPVYAIGNSAGYFSNTFTGGFISGLNRTLRLTENSIEMDYIQTDATINPGNSGGPLVNSYGQVVGINDFTFVGANKECENMTFAIAINEAIPIINNLMSNGYVKGRPRIGITYTAITESVAEEQGMVAGLCIAEVAQDCDISNCDIKPGDIITQVKGKDVYSSSMLNEVLETCQAGDTITARVYRQNENGDGEYHDISFKLEEYDR